MTRTHIPHIVMAYAVNSLHWNVPLQVIGAEVIAEFLANVLSGSWAFGYCRTLHWKTMGGYVGHKKTAMTFYFFQI